MDIAHAFDKMPGAVVALLVGSFVLWFIGGYLVSARSIKREGGSVWQLFNPFSLSGLRLNRQEWLLLLALAIICLSGAAFAINWRAWWQV